MALTLEYEQSNTTSMQNFLYRFESANHEIKREQSVSPDEVRVMTIHGAKGLQAPIVFLADADRTTKSSERIFWNPKSSTPSLIWPQHEINNNSLCDTIRQEDKQRVEAEKHRLLYVAMTRAEDRLIVCGQSKQTKKSISNWYTRVKSALESMEPEVLVDGILRCSSEQTKDSDNKIENINSHQYPLPAWANKKAPKEEGIIEFLNHSISFRKNYSLSPSSNSSKKAINRGILIHKLLEFLPDVELDNRKDIARQFIVNNSDGLSTSSCDEILMTTINILTGPAYEKLFGVGSRAEVPIIGKIANRTISGQIDRLLVTDDEVFIVDYKTSHFVPENQQGVPKSYLRQMANYRDLISQIYPQRLVFCVLLWTSGPKWMNLSDDIINEAMT